MYLPKSEIEAILLLNRISSAYARTGIRLIEKFPSVQTFFERYEAGCIQLPKGILKTLASPIEDSLHRLVERDQQWLEGSGNGLISIFDADYPVLLKQIYDPPLCLYLRGKRSLLNQQQMAIVGSRRPTQSGRRIAESFAQSLSAMGLVITSGMAAGIDAASHVGALGQSGETIAVFGTGCDVIYPSSHGGLARKILAQGLLVSEFPPGARGQASHFPQRNRIVTGLSFGTLVVEAALKSGSLISARLAMEHGREVFAVPGTILDPLSAGCLQLIKDGAVLTRNIDDIVNELPNRECQKAAIDPPLLSSLEQQILAQMGTTPVNVDHLYESTGIEISELVSHLVKLEIEGHVIEEYGNYILSNILPGNG
ncbi:MAG: DNA-processing protein DprA [Pseudomonadales bacterium]|nr:DNA-processing protein DprA [Pseudomonadales bacterium]